jgi:hypothetical protein
MLPIESSLSDYREMIELFDGESDRGAAVLAGSYVENFLGLFLRAQMTDPSLAEKVFSAQGSLSSFSQRIDFAQGFGFLPEKLCAQLHLIRKIRNHFAHHPKSASFSGSPVKEWVKALAASESVPVGDDKSFKLDDGRLAYLVSAGMFVVVATNQWRQKHGVV